MPTRPAYPRHWEADIVARDGATMHVRPILPADAPGLQALHLAQSERSRFFRFFGHRGALTEAELERFTHVDHRDRVALVVTDRDGGPLLAFGCYDAVDARTAEVAFYVADSQQGRGLGSVLLDHLAAAGRERGFTRLVADVLPTNAKMLAVFREAGYTVDSGFEDGVVEVSVDLATTDKSWRVMTAREQFSESRSMRVLMDPGRILPVGAGRAARLLDLLGVSGTTGPGEGTLAVVAVDDADLPATLERLGGEGVRAAVVLSGRGARDPGWHAAVLETARGTGLRLLGPGSYGLLTGAGANLTLVPALAGGGAVGVFAQSARSSAELAGRLVAHDLAVSGFVSAGHRIDVSGNDAMQWWMNDERTRVVALSLDSIGNPRKFARIAGHLATTRTVLCHIHSATGQSAPPGHVVRTSPLPRAVLSDMLRQAGVIEAADHEELIDLAHVASRRAVTGPRVLIDATTPPAGEFVSRAARARGLLPVAAGADARIAVDLPLAGEPDEWRREVSTADASIVVATSAPDTRAPVVDDVDRAVRLVAALATARPRDDSPLVAAEDAVPSGAAALLAEHDGGLLAPEAAAALLATYGIEVVPEVCAGGIGGAREVAARLGYPLAVKAQDPVLRHRVDLGGVHLDVHDDADLVHAVGQLADLGVATVCLQRMVPPGPACVLEAVEDPLYGPVVSFGLAGDAVEILGDVSYRITPLSQRDVAELVAEPRASVRFRGHRGRPGYDLEPLRDLVGRLALLKDDFPVIRRITVNPVVVSHAGAFPLAAEVEVGGGARTDGSRRTLPTLGLE